MTDYTDAGAEISKDGKYRYLLWREWRLKDTPPAYWRWFGAKDGVGKKLGKPKSCVFVMLNPSTADAEKDDATIRRCVGFAQAWKYDRLEVVNLFGYRTKNPRELMALTHNDDPVGVHNQHYVTKTTLRSCAGLVVCAWGTHGGHLGQDETVKGWIDQKIYTLGFTKHGYPKHPLYAPCNSTLCEWR